jgi:hypothetical protein
MPITIYADPPLAPKSEICLTVVRPKSLALVFQDDDTSRALVYGSVCQLLRREWPGALAAH